MLHLLLAALTELERAISLPLDIRNSEMNAQCCTIGCRRLIRSSGDVVFLSRFHLLDTSIISMNTTTLKLKIQFAVCSQLAQSLFGVQITFFWDFLFFTPPIIASFPRSRSRFLFHQSTHPPAASSSVKLKLTVLECIHIMMLTVE